MGFCRGCRGMTGYGLGSGTSLLLIRRFMLIRGAGVVVVCDGRSVEWMIGRLIDSQSRSNAE